MQNTPVFGIEVKTWRPLTRFSKYQLTEEGFEKNPLW